MRRLVLANPHATRLGEPEALRNALGALNETELRFTSRPGEATELARQAGERGHGVVVAAGGDGTVNEVVNGLLDPERGAARGVRLGILPLGTGNDLARSLGVPLELEGAIEVLRAARSRMVDVGRAELAADDGGRCRRLFLNMATGGFPSEVSETLDTETKRAWGPLAYLRSAIDVAEELTGFACRLEPAGDEPLELAVFSVSVANGQTVAGGIPAAPRARLDDGLLDVVVIPAQSLTQLALLLPQIAAGRHLEAERVRSARTSRLHLDAEPPFRIHLDGEDAGMTPARFTVLPRCLEVIVGPHPPEGVLTG